MIRLFKVSGEKDNLLKFATQLYKLGINFGRVDGGIIVRVYHTQLTSNFDLFIGAVKDNNLTTEHIR